jgi:hypothetical protein
VFILTNSFSDDVKTMDSAVGIAGSTFSDTDLNAFVELHKIIKSKPVYLMTEIYLFEIRK